MLWGLFISVSVKFFHMCTMRKLCKCYWTSFSNFVFREIPFVGWNWPWWHLQPGDGNDTNQTILLFTFWETELLNLYRTVSLRVLTSAEKPSFQYLFLFWAFNLWKLNYLLHVLFVLVFQLCLQYLSGVLQGGKWSVRIAEKHVYPGRGNKKLCLFEKSFSTSLLFAGPRGSCEWKLCFHCGKTGWQNHFRPPLFTIHTLTNRLVRKWIIPNLLLLACENKDKSCHVCAPVVVFLCFIHLFLMVMQS